MTKKDAYHQITKGYCRKIVFVFVIVFVAFGKVLAYSRQGVRKVMARCSQAQASSNSLRRVCEMLANSLVRANEMRIITATLYATEQAPTLRNCVATIRVTTKTKTKTKSYRYVHVDVIVNKQSIINCQLSTNNNP